MTQDTTITDELAAVEQCDRDAAARIARIFLGNADTLPDELKSGELERHWLLDELLAFRLSTRPKETPTEQGEVAGSIVHRLMACFDFSDVLSVEEIRDMVADEAQAIEGEILASLSHPVSTNMQVAEAAWKAALTYWGLEDWELEMHEEPMREYLSTITASSTTEGDGE